MTEQTENEFHVALPEIHIVPVPEGATIPAGTMVVLHPDAVNDYCKENEAIVAAGQNLQRELYPELSGQYPGTGGFHNFNVPDLENRILLGFDDGGMPIMGSVVIHYKTYPPVEIVHRTIGQQIEEEDRG